MAAGLGAAAALAQGRQYASFFARDFSDVQYMIISIFICFESDE
jgi:hypothetical protein